MKKIIIIVITFINFIIVINVFARITPEDILNSKKEAYEAKIQNYSPENKKKLENLAKEIAEINKNRTGELERIMKVQAAVLDEYEARSEKKGEQEKNKANIEKARYWITYAHEAVAYQAAKIYVFNLTSETNIKSDAFPLVNLFYSELNSTRSKVITSQKTLQSIVR